MIEELFASLNNTRAFDPNPSDLCAAKCSCFCTANDPKKDDSTEDKDGEIE